MTVGPRDRADTDTKAHRRVADRGAPVGETHADEHTTAADQRYAEAVPEYIGEDTQDRNEEETYILRQRRVLARLDGVNVEALVR